MVAAIILLYAITIVVYSFFPLLIALLRSKTISAKKYRRICYISNIILVVADYSLGSGKDFSRNLLPFILWTPLGIWFGGKILKSKGLLDDEKSEIEVTSESQDTNLHSEITSSAEKKFICNNCGKLSTGWYQTCPNCGAIGKMEKASPAKIQAAEHLQDKENRIIASGGWRCAKCGKAHFAYESSCSCGASRFAENNQEPDNISTPEAEHNNMPREKSVNEPATIPQIGVSEGQEVICDNCGAILPAGAKFCSNCGQTVIMLPVVKYCRFCGSKLTKGSKYCHNCGKEAQLDLAALQISKVQKRSEKELQEHKQQIHDDFSMPSYSTNSVLYKDNKEYIDSLVSEGGLNMKIALYVASDVVLIERGIRDIDLDHDLEVVWRELVFEYGVLGAVMRYSFVLGLFLQLGALSQEEVEAYTNRKIAIAGQEIKRISKENKP